ncbi:MAG: leucine-rich repeat domain-containing protein [Clostridia bacterium]|nr:leucine-rich repeat domain-containing protein [Clostridia bacterium]
MKKTNKFLAIILAILMAISIIPISASAATSGKCGDNLTWSYDSSTYTLTISGTGDMYDNNPPWAKYQNNIKEIVISDGVTSIGRAAFFGIIKMTSITIPESITSISELAFYGCSSLTSITVDPNNTFYSDDEFGVLFNKDKTELIQYPIGNIAVSYMIPESVTKIGSYAFYDCNKLVNITLPDSITIIDDWAFGFNKNITSMIIPDSVSVIGNYAFHGCSSLKSISLGNGVTKIGEGAFYNCTSITDVTIPKSVTSLGNIAFIYCFSLTNITVESDNQYYSSDEYGVLFNKDKTTLIQYPIANTRIAYEIPDGVTTIAEYAFSDSIRLSYLTFPVSVTSIEDYAFQNCDELRRVYYYGTEEQWNDILIGNNNSKLTSATKYFECKGDEPGLGTYGDNLTYSYDSRTKTLTISGTGDMVDYDYNNQPWDKYYLEAKEVIISEGVTSIGASAFERFWSLEKVTIPDGVTSIGKNAFDLCNISSIIIPDSVTVIDEAFYGNFYLYDVYYTGTVSQWNDMLKNSEDTGFYYPTIHCTDGKVYPSGSCGDNVFWHLDTTTMTLTISGTGEMENYSEYHYTPPWSIYFYTIKHLVVNDGVETIGDYAFFTCDKLESVALPDSLKSIGEEAFSYCNSLTNITIPDSVTTIGRFAFYSCSGLKSVTLGRGLKELGYRAFISCNALKDVYYGGSKNRWETVLMNSSQPFPNGVNFHYSDIGDDEGHTHIYDVFVTQATCTAQGYTRYICSICDGCYDDNFVSPTGHNYESTSTVAPTCTFSGYIKYTCTACGSYYNDYIQNLGHKYETVVTEPTCTEQGYTTQKCTACGNTIIDNYVDATGHSCEWVIITEPLCVKNGLKSGNCSVCGEITETIPSLGHDYGEYQFEYEPTCTKEGRKSKQCSRCGNQTDVIFVPATGHTYGEWEQVTEGTCKEYVQYERACSTCGEKRFMSAPAEHDYSIEHNVVEATCTTSGSKTVECSYCGNTKTETIPAIGHNYETVVTAPTCTERGYTTYICECSDSYVDNYVDSSGHDYAQIVNAPTCTEQGYTTYTCECGDSYVDDYIDATGHTPADAVEENYVAPTCTENGSKEVVVYCSVCDEEISKDTVTLEATGHEDADNDGYCNDCDFQICNHHCHKSGILGFLWKILNIFNRIFGLNKVCECGAAHY